MAKTKRLAGIRFKVLTTDSPKVHPNLQTVYVTTFKVPTPSGGARTEYVRLALDEYDENVWRLDRMDPLFPVYESNVRDRFDSLEAAAAEVARRYGA